MIRMDVIKDREKKGQRRRCLDLRGPRREAWREGSWLMWGAGRVGEIYDRFGCRGDARLGRPLQRLFSQPGEERLKP